MEDISVGDLVVLSPSESIVRRSLELIGYRWDNEMDPMLGKSYSVFEVLDNDVIAIESPDGSQDGKWYFHRSAFINFVIPGK